MTHIYTGCPPQGERLHLAEETVTVYPTGALPALDQKPVAKFKGRAYSRAGFDHYTYKGTMYDGYVDANLNPCIFLDRPTGVKHG